MYCLVCEKYPSAKTLCRIRERGGFNPALTDEEVITMEICGELLKQSTDKDPYDYFYQHYQHFFPQWGDRSLFVRQAANLWAVKSLIQARLVKRKKVSRGLYRYEVHVTGALITVTVPLKKSTTTVLNWG